MVLTFGGLAKGSKGGFRVLQLSRPYTHGRVRVAVQTSGDAHTESRRFGDVWVVTTR